MNIIRNNKALCMGGTALVTIGRYLGELNALGPRMKSRKYSLKHGYAKDPVEINGSITGRFSSRDPEPQRITNGLIQQQSVWKTLAERELFEADYSIVERRSLAHYAEECPASGRGCNFIETARGKMCEYCGLDY